MINLMNGIFDMDTNLRQRVVFTNGCFDFVHPGHVYLFKYIKELYPGCKLIVGVNSDASIKRLKGKSRPVYPESDRLMMLDSIEFIDTVILFDEDTPLELIKQVQPDILVKGMDYVNDKVVGADLVEVVSHVKLKPGYSTTALIKYIKQM